MDRKKHGQAQINNNLNKKKVYLIFLAYYELRYAFLVQIIEYYLSFKKLESIVQKIIVVWNDGEIPVPPRLQNNPMVAIIFAQKNSLNNRWILPIEEVFFREMEKQSTYNINDLGIDFDEANQKVIVMHDDDLVLKPKALMMMINSARRYPNRVSTHFVRYLDNTKYYTSRLPRNKGGIGHKYNMGLSIVTFGAGYLLKYRKLPQKALDFVDSDSSHCDDVLFNMLVANVAKSAPVYVNLPEKSIHDFHFFSFYGDKNLDEKVSDAEDSTKYATSRAAARVRCYKKLMSIFREHSISQVSPGGKHRNESPYLITGIRTKKVDVYLENKAIVHPCKKRAYNTFYSNRFKYIPENIINSFWGVSPENVPEKEMSDYKKFRKKGFTEIYQTSMKTKYLRSVYEAIFEYKRVIKRHIHGVSGGFLSNKTKFGEYHMLLNRCYILHEDCLKLASDTKLINLAHYYLFGKEPSKIQSFTKNFDRNSMHIISMDIYEAKNTFDWRVNMENYNSCLGEIICGIIYVGNKNKAPFQTKSQRGIRVMSGSHLLPSVFDLIGFDLLRAKTTSMQEDIENKMLNCSNKYNPSSQYQILNKMNPGDVVFMSNELWNAIESPIVKSTDMNSDLYIKNLFCS